MYILFDLFNPYDSTDDEKNGERSGLVLYTDNLTGCQYLNAGYFGGMSPRLDKSGNQVGCKQFLGAAWEAGYLDWECPVGILETRSRNGRSARKQETWDRLRVHRQIPSIALVAQGHPTYLKEWK